MIVRGNYMETRLSMNWPIVIGPSQQQSPTCLGVNQWSMLTPLAIIFQIRHLSSLPMTGYSVAWLVMLTVATYAVLALQQKTRYCSNLLGIGPVLLIVSWRTWPSFAWEDGHFCRQSITGPYLENELSLWQGPVDGCCVNDMWLWEDCGNKVPSIVVGHIGFSNRDMEQFMLGRGLKFDTSRSLTSGGVKTMSRIMHGSVYLYDRSIGHDDAGREGDGLILDDDRGRDCCWRWKTLEKEG